MNVFAFLFIWPVSASAVPSDHNQREVFLFERLSLDFQPSEGFFFVEVSGSSEVVRVPAVLIPPYRSETDDGIASGEWLAGVRVLLRTDVPSVNYSVIAASPVGDYGFSPWKKRSFAADHPEVDSIDALRDLLVQRKTISSSLRTQVTAQRESLQRLRADARAIGKLDKMTEIEDKLESINRYLEHLDDDTQNLKRFILLVKESQTPRHFSRREIQLTKQLKEIAAAAKEIEADELGRKAFNERRLQERLRLIESTRYDHPRELNLRLAKLQKHRRALEQQLGITAEELMGLSPSGGTHRPVNEQYE